jgi:hypothetical protein
MEEDFRTLARLLAERADADADAPDPAPAVEAAESEQLGLF